MKKYYIILLISTFSITWGCNDDEFLNKKPQNVLLDEQIWSNPSLILSVLGDLYVRLPDMQSLGSWQEQVNFDFAFPSAFGEYWRVDNPEYDYNWWRWYDYGYMRQVNIFIQNLKGATQLKEADQKRFLAEGRFIRAFLYFEMVKRMGGVPIITVPEEYDFSGDPTYLQHPRAKESEVYDYVINELDTIKNDLPDDVNEKSRATKAAALAMKARAALYAGSIAKYGVNTPTVTLAGGEVGIPANRAPEYFTIALRSAQELIKGGKYSLYKKKPDLQDNFANIFLDKSNNSEVIFVIDYKLKVNGAVHNFTQNNQPRSSAEEQQGGRLNPSLNLAQSFEKLDNTFSPFVTIDSTSGDYIYYTNPGDIFAGRDARLGGTIFLPGASFKGKPLDIWAGYFLTNGTVITGNNFGALGNVPGKANNIQVVGGDGPIDGLEFGTQTGFYIRKYLDPAVGSGQIGTQSDVWWVRYRYGEVLLNAAEACFELNKLDSAAIYMNQVRARAGLNTPLLSTDITFSRIVHERKVELAFEGLEFFDLKRWRLAHIVWDGSKLDLTNHPERPDEPSTRPFGLWPYKFFDSSNPANVNNNKYVFKEVLPNRVKQGHRFRLGNYYSRFDDNAINRNPKLFRNPNQ